MKGSYSSATTIGVTKFMSAYSASMPPRYQCFWSLLHLALAYVTCLVASAVPLSIGPSDNDWEPFLAIPNVQSKHFSRTMFSMVCIYEFVELIVYANNLGLTLFFYHRDFILLACSLL